MGFRVYQVPEQDPFALLVLRSPFRSGQQEKGCQVARGARRDESFLENSNSRRITGIFFELPSGQSLRHHSVSFHGPELALPCMRAFYTRSESIVPLYKEGYSGTQIGCRMKSRIVQGSQIYDSYPHRQSSKSGSIFQVPERVGRQPCRKYPKRDRNPIYLLICILVLSRLVWSSLQSRMPESLNVNLLFSVPY